MKIIKENTLKEAVKPKDFTVKFKSIGDGLYTIYLDDMKAGIFDEDNLSDFIKAKIEFVKKLEKLVEKA